MSVISGGLVWVWNLLPTAAQVVLSLGCQVVDKVSEAAGFLKL